MTSGVRILYLIMRRNIAWCFKTNFWSLTMKLRSLTFPYRETIDNQSQIFSDHFSIRATEFHRMRCYAVCGTSSVPWDGIECSDHGLYHHISKQQKLHSPRGWMLENYYKSSWDFFWSNFSLFGGLIYLLYMCECFASMVVCVTNVCLVPKEVSSQISQKGN